MEKWKRSGYGDRGGARTHVLKITDLVLYLYATHALWKLTNKKKKNKTE